MLDGLFIEATRSLRDNGWRQQEDPTLFWHPEFGAHEFFKACYIERRAGRIRRRLWWSARIRPAIYILTVGGLLLVAAYNLATRIL